MSESERNMIKAWIDVARKVPLRHVVRQVTETRNLQKGVWEFECPSCHKQAMGINVLNVWHCFTCGDGGGQVQYLMRRGLSHEEALKWLVNESRSE